jgi:predicted nucleic acid-binding protein
VTDVLVDTDVFADHLRGVRELRRGDDVIAFSAITRAELLAARDADDDRVTALLAPFQELDVDRDVAELAGRLCREAAIALPDAVIAATAIRSRLELITRSPSRFEAVSDLRLRES